MKDTKRLGFSKFFTFLNVFALGLRISFKDLKTISYWLRRVVVMFSMKFFFFL